MKPTWVAVLCFCVCSLRVACASPTHVEIISVSADNVAGDGYSSSPVLSSDGRYAAFLSEADNLVEGYSGISNQNGFNQVYFVDRQTHQLELISVSADGTAGADADSLAPQVSADGRYVGFLTSAHNLITPGHGDSQTYNFVIRDRVAGITFAPAHDWIVPSLDDPYAYASVDNSNRLMTSDATVAAIELNLDPNQPDDIYVLDSITGLATAVCPPRVPYTGMPCANPSLSSDGSAVAFESAYPNLIEGGTNGHFDVFAYDVSTGAIVLASVNADGSEGDGDIGYFGGEYDHMISGDGRYVAFDSGQATNLGGSNLPNDVLLVKDLSTGALVPVSTTDDGTPVGLNPSQGPHPWFSDTATLLVFSGTTTELDPGPNDPGGAQVFVRDMSSGISRSICRNSSGFRETGCYHPTLSGDGSTAAFDSEAPGMLPFGVDPGPTTSEQVYVSTFAGVFDDIFADGFDG